MVYEVEQRRSILDRIENMDDFPRRLITIAIIIGMVWVIVGIGVAVSYIESVIIAVAVFLSLAIPTLVAVAMYVARMHDV